MKSVKRSPFTPAEWILVPLIGLLFLLLFRLALEYLALLSRR